MTITRVTHLSPRDWESIYALRDRLPPADRTVLRKFIKYVEWKERDNG